VDDSGQVFYHLDLNPCTVWTSMFSLGSAFGMLVTRCHPRAHCNERDSARPVGNSQTRYCVTGAPERAYV
jgi:hypothetical protein